MFSLAELGRVHRHNLHTFRQSPLAEVSGALGDLGTLLPLMITLAIQGSIYLDSTLVFNGVFNIVTGAVFGIPLPVQPMKAIAAAAISRYESLGTTVMAGGWVAIAVLILSVTGLLTWLARVIPVPVVKGIQLGAGLSLIIGAGNSLLGHLHWVSPLLDNRLWALFAFVILIGTQQFRRFPYALFMFILALIFAAIRIGVNHHHFPRFHLWFPYVHIPHWLSGRAASMAVGQLPLTTLNSIIAVQALSQELFPDLPAPSVTALGLSVAAMNLSGFMFGVMPVCHGAGGLAAQTRFGARSGASIIILGLFKLVVGLFLGDTLLDLLTYYPTSILGIMVIAAGLELAKVGQSLNYGASDLWESSLQEGEGVDNGPRLHRDLSDTERLERWNIMLMTTAGILAFKNDAIGFLAGMLCYWSYRFTDRIRQWRGARQLGLDETDPLIRR